jgi:mono/diheme cytochrome c family protein
MARGWSGATAAILALCLAAPVSAADGARVYANQCSGCHGDDGKGDGPAAAALLPRPKDLRSPEVWRGRSDAALYELVKRGKPGTMMPPFEGILSDEEVAAVVMFIRRFDPAAAPQPPSAGRPQ